MKYHDMGWYSESNLHINGGKKFDSGKDPEHLYSIPAHKRLMRVLRHGADKYGERNWEQGMEWSRVYAAIERHLHAWQNGEDIDPDSGEPHLACAQAGLMFLNHYEEKKIGTDNRPHRINKHG